MNFKILVSFVVLIICFVNSKGEVPPTVGDLTRQAVETIKETNKGGKEKSVEFLDIIHFDNQQVNLCGPIMCISANLTEATLRGLGGMEFVKSEFASNGPQVTLDLDVKLPSLVLESGYYEMKGAVMQALPLAGRGKLYLETKNLRLWTKVTMKITEDGTTIENLDNSGFSIQNIYSRTEFDGNIDAIFNAMVEELLVVYLNRFNKAIAAHYTQLIKELLNPIL